MARVGFPWRHHAGASDVSNSGGARPHVLEGQQAEGGRLSWAMAADAMLEENGRDVARKGAPFLR